jgi:transposase InsO family protein
VPTTHERADEIPAVSCSSGHVHVQHAKAEASERTWPGRVFEDPTLSYEEAMLAFIAASQEQRDSHQFAFPAALAEQADARAAKRAFHREEVHLRDERRVVRHKRKMEDEAWRALRVERKAAVQAYQALSSREERRQQGADKEAQDAQWRAAWERRQALMAERQAEDAAWHQVRQRFRERWSEWVSTRTWLAILVVVDSCTRQCLGLPLFVAGVNVTAEVVAEALHALLPPELRFLISDRGTHFTAGTFKMRFLNEAFIHVYIARHRPESNAIAERFVRTLKAWLEHKSWADGQELAPLLEQFQGEYNDRPHQGLALSGLSPNEFANRVWLL